MLTLLGAAGFEPEWPSAVLCVGTFDGFHLGHQSVIKAAVAAARVAALPCGLVTFDRHPSRTLAPNSAPKTLSQATDHEALLSELGVDLTVVLAFDEKLSQTTADSFLNEILVKKLRASQLVVGHDFALGKGREGTTSWLSARIPTTVVPPFELNGIRVSSSAIRGAIEAGDLDAAAAMLGRRFSLRGLIVSGDKLGRTLGFPTANLALPANQILPPDGVYAAKSETPFGTFSAAVSIGNRPTVNGISRVIEAYLLDYSGESLYGRAVTLQLCRRIREQKRLNSLEELKEWIADDVNKVRAVLA